ncbi:peptidoglycan-binding domain-containing protein (plasmid) [Streptomyces rochei]|nr:peptidoglycan-binding domain-containing protein [Streptomyces rochei]WMI61950.1 peptidoglycan-binding domain-containing protein [Streptomyces rochei]
MLHQRRQVVAAVAAGAVLMTAGGVAAGSVVRSPQQVMAEAGPPPPDVLTAPVRKQVIADMVVTRGTVSAAQTVRFTPNTPPGEGAPAAVVTRTMVAPGDDVRPGRVLVEISGRPVFALRGAVPVYRDLRTGVRGGDVTQLRRALAIEGFTSTGDAEGVFGPATARAVAAFYGRLGYRPRLHEETGTAMVPTSELVFLSSFPARLEATNAQVGGPVEADLLTLSAGELTVRGTVAPHEHGLLRKKQKVRIHSETTGLTTTGTVYSLDSGTALPAASADGGAGSDTAPASRGTGTTGSAPPDGGPGILVRPDKPLPAALAGQGVRLTVEAASSDGPVLAVPVSAVSGSADGTTTVTVLEPGGDRRRVEVRTGSTGDGLVEVAAIGSARLGAAEAVVVGLRTDREQAP